MYVSKWLPLAILAAYICLAVSYTVLIPLYEPQDENYHFAYAQYVSQTGQLPVQNPSVTQPWKQEGSQAPLYYVMAGLIVRLVPGADAPYLLTSNPHAIVGLRAATDNRNIFTHTSAELFPWRGPVLAMHLIRLLGVALGFCALVFVFLAARLVFPDTPLLPVIALAFTAFNPMFLMQMACVNNDALVTAMGAISIWLVVRMWRRGFSWRLCAWLAVALALTGLSKASGLTAGVVAGAALTAMAWKRKITVRQDILALLLLGGVFATGAGWWYIRNIQLYGDLTGLRILSEIVGLRVEPFSVNALLRDMDLLRVSFWGFYGWENYFIGPVWLPQVMDVLTALAIAGGIIWLIGTIRSKALDALIPVGLLGLNFVLMILLIVNYTWQIPASVGRLMLPAMTSIAVLAALGWYSAAKAIRLRWLSAGPVLVLAVVAILSPFMTLAPAYAMPPAVSALPSDATPVDARFSTIEVLGYRVDRQPVAPGGVVPVTVYYRGTPDPRNLSLYLTLLGRDNKMAGKVDSYPGGGMLPTALWQPGTIYADTYRVPVAPDAVGPVLLRIEFGWWDRAAKLQISPSRADGSKLDSLILRGTTLTSTTALPPPSVTQSVTFGGLIGLDGYAISPADGSVPPGQQISLALRWRGLKAIPEDFNVFVHLQTPDGKLVAQADSAPLDGAYPTSAWVSDQPFDDTYVLTLDRAKVPPGTYQIVIGLYRLVDGTRLTVQSADGQTTGDSVTLQTPISVP